jgi:putative ABC transport system ATP-binding protein
MIKLRDLHKSYVMGSNRLHVLKGLDLDIGGNELVAIMGASGSGKSTLLNVLGLLDNYDEGTYHLDGVLMRDLSEAKAAHYRSQLLGFVFQSFHLIPFKNAIENIALPLYYQGVPRRERNRRAGELLEKMGLGPWAEHRPRELSGGQQQRVAIARSLVTRPKVLLADEPTGALDSQTSREIMELLKQIHADGMSLIIVTHEHEVAAATQRIIRLRDGRIEADMTTAQFLAGEAAAAVAEVEAVQV